MWCWGLGADGRLGTGADADAASPAKTKAAPASGIASGGAHSCAILLDGTVDCWGANDEGQLGQPDDVGPSSSAPVRVPGLTQVRQLSAGSAHTCARRDDGTVWCWGSNTTGQLGDDSELVQLKPQLVRLSCH